MLSCSSTRDTDIIWCNAHSCGLEVTMTVLHGCPASIFSGSLLASKHEIVPRVNESAFIL